jgi:dihydroflavonol-4-reductase
MIAVTGATGHVGNVLVRALLESGEEIRVAVRPGADFRMLDSLDVELFEADVLDLSALEHVFHGCNLVFHLDGLEVLRHGRESLGVTLIAGARNVVSACLTTGTRRLIQAVPLEALQASTQAGSLPALQARASLEVRRGIERGLNAVIAGLAPAIGPHDYGPSETSRLIIDFGHGRFMAWAEGSLPFMNVVDAAQMLMLAASQERWGETITLPGEELSVREIMGSLQILTGVSPPILRLSPALSRAALSCGLRVLAPGPSTCSIATGSHLASSSPASGPESGLAGMAIHPVRQALVEAVVWFRQRGLLPPHS